MSARINYFQDEIVRMRAVQFNHKFKLSNQNPITIFSYDFKTVL
jgi:hypothetical protein